MTDPMNPLLERIRGQLTWPEWSSWALRTSHEGLEITLAPIDHNTRAMAIGRRLERTRTIDQGGPYRQIFKQRARERLSRDVGQPLGPLASFTFAIKDLIAVSGYPMSAASAVRADVPPESESAPIVARLEALGAVAVGLVTLHEFAFGVTGINPHGGTPTNPAAPDRITGGSSSGSAAAVADGSARIAIGTDTGGSIRVPASFCGVVGFKPSFGLYPTDGVYPLSGTLDHVGLFATTVADIATTHRSLGYEVTKPQLPKRIGVVRAQLDDADSDVRDLLEGAIEALRRAGCEVVEIELPPADLVFAVSTAIMFSEAATVHRPSLDTASERYGADVLARLTLGAKVSAADVAGAHELRRHVIGAIHGILSGVDGIIGPSTPMVAPRIADAADPALAARIVANTRLANVTGLPAISLPLPSAGAPVGLQLLGRHDADVLAHAEAVEGLLGEL